MGCDGGALPRRRELCSIKKKTEQRDSAQPLKNTLRMHRWAHCALSQHLLAKPVVACEMGKLYNKEAIIELLLSDDRSQAPSWIEHVEKLKDVVELDLTPNPAYLPNLVRGQGTSGENMLCSMFMCPVTGLEMNGSFRFFFAFSTGKVVSERGLKVLQKDPEEKDLYKEDDLILINPVDEEIDEQNAAMVARRTKAKAERKAAKAAKKGSSSVGADDCFKKPCLPDQSITDEPLAKKAKTARAFKDQGKGKKSKKKPEESVYRVGDMKVFNPFAEQARKEKEHDALPERDLANVKNSVNKADLSSLTTTSIQEGNKSEVFKKMFTTHKTAQDLPKGHWVTFDPRYHFG